MLNMDSDDQADMQGQIVVATSSFHQIRIRGQSFDTGGNGRRLVLSRPNPTHDATYIEYTLPTRARACGAALCQRWPFGSKRSSNQDQDPGTYQAAWNGWMRMAFAFLRGLLLRGKLGTHSETWRVRGRRVSSEPVKVQAPRPLGDLVENGVRPDSAGLSPVKRSVHAPMRAAEVCFRQSPPPQAHPRPSFSIECRTGAARRPDRGRCDRSSRRLI